MGLSFSRLFLRSREMRILMLGLDNAGKTTILYKLKLGKAENTVPTVGFNVETIKFRNITMHTWDIGGQERIRALWRHYFSGTDCLIFVIDSSDHQRLEQAKSELWKVIRDKELAGCLLVVLANKQDVPGALKSKDVIDKVGLESIEDHPWCVIPTVATTGVGLTEALSWISGNSKAKDAKTKESR